MPMRQVVFKVKGFFMLDRISYKDFPNFCYAMYILSPDIPLSISYGIPNIINE